MKYIILRFIIKIICKLKVIGLEKIPLKGVCIIASNHIGRLEGFWVYTIISRSDIIFPMAKKYKNTIFLSWLVNSLYGIWIDQYNVDIEAYRKIEKKLEKGGILCISPEGTRSKTVSLIQVKPGGFLLGFEISGSNYPCSHYRIRRSGGFKKFKETKTSRSINYYRTTILFKTSL